MGQKYSEKFMVVCKMGKCTQWIRDAFNTWPQNKQYNQGQNDQKL